MGAKPVQLANAAAGRQLAIGSRTVQVLGAGAGSQAGTAHHIGAQTLQVVSGGGKLLQIGGVTTKAGTASLQQIRHTVPSQVAGRVVSSAVPAQSLMMGRGSGAKGTASSPHTQSVSLSPDVINQLIQSGQLKGQTIRTVTGEYGLLSLAIVC